MQLGGCPSESTSKAFRVCQKQVEANLFFWGGKSSTLLSNKPTGIAKKDKRTNCHYWQLGASITLIIMANIYLLTFHGSYRSEGLSCWPDPQQQQACLANYETSVYVVHPFTSFLWPILLDFLTCGRICEHNQVVRSYPHRFVVVVSFVYNFLLPHCVGFHYHRAPSFNVTGWFWSGQCSVGGYVYGCKNTFHVSVNEKLNFIYILCKCKLFPSHSCESKYLTLDG